MSASPTSRRHSGVPRHARPAGWRRARSPAPAPQATSRRQRRGPSGCVRACVRQRNSKATPRKISPISMAMIGRIEGRHQHGISERKRRHHAAATEHEPGLVAVPDRRDAVHDDVAVGLRRKQRKENAEAEIKAVHHHIDEHGEGDDERPESCEVDRRTHGAILSTAGVMPAARAGILLGGPASPGCGGCAISRSR